MAPLVGITCDTSQRRDEKTVTADRPARGSTRSTRFVVPAPNAAGVVAWSMYRPPAPNATFEERIVSP